MQPKSRIVIINATELGTARCLFFICAIIGLATVIGKTMMPEQNNLHACVQACEEVIHASQACAAADIREGNGNSALINLDCAKMCTATMNASARGSKYHGDFCRLCAHICRTCAAACALHAKEDAHCVNSQRACEKCAAECDKHTAEGDI